MTAEQTPKTGDTVTISAKGKVVYPFDGGLVVELNATTHSRITILYAGNLFKIEVEEPAYEVGAVYQSATGSVFYRRSNTPDIKSWRDVSSGMIHPDDYPSRPLVKLVPDTTSNAAVDPWTAKMGTL